MTYEDKCEAWKQSDVQFISSYIGDTWAGDWVSYKGKVIKYLDRTKRQEYCNWYIEMDELYGRWDE